MRAGREHRSSHEGNITESIDKTVYKRIRGDTSSYPAIAQSDANRLPVSLPLAFQLADLGSHVILEVIAQEVHRAPYRKRDLVNAKILRAMMDVTKNPEIVLVVVNPVQELFLTEVLLVLVAIGVPLPEVR